MNFFEELMENKEVKKTMKTLQVEGEKFGKNVVAYGKDLGIKLGKEATKFGKKAGEYAKTYSQILKLKAELEKTKYDIGNAIVKDGLTKSASNTKTKALVAKAKKCETQITLKTEQLKKLEK